MRFSSVILSRFQLVLNEQAVSVASIPDHFARLIRLIAVLQVLPGIIIFIGLHQLLNQGKILWCSGQP
jgi:hypothetical protein